MIYARYGSPDVLQLKEVHRPTPKDNEILIKVKATAVNSADVRLRKADPWAVRLFFGLTKPRKNILGGVFSGEVEAVGKNVTKFKKGDAVFGSAGMRFGAYAEYLCLKEDATLAIKPTSINHTEAGTIPFGGTTALHFIRKAKIEKGQKVLIYGASGAVGSAAVQLAKYFGAHVTAVCGPSNMEMVKSLGADKVIDYTKEDFTKNGEVYDVIYETVNKISFSESIHSLSKKGTLLLGAGGLPHMLLGIWVSMVGGCKVVTGVISEKAEDIAFLKRLIEDGKYKAVVDRSYSLQQIVDAHRYVEQGHKKGNVAILVNEI